MFSPFTFRSTLGMWLIQLGSRMLSRPCWLSGAVVLQTKSRGALVGHTLTIAPFREQVQALSDVNSELCALLADTANAKEPLPARLLWCSRLDPNRDIAGSPGMMWPN